MRLISATAAAVLVMCAASGCYGPMRTPYGYGPPAYPPSYGGTYPGGAYPGGIPTMTPGGTYVPQGTIVPNGGSSGTSNQTYENQLSPTPDGGNAPPYNPSPGGTGSGGVPNYPDANQNDFLPPVNRPSNEPANGGASSPFFEPQGAAPASAPPQGSVDATTPAHQPNVQAAATFPASPAVAVVQKPGEAMGNPYAYDADEYRWLRGIVTFDDSDRSWNIIYSVDPDEDDPYAGHMTLAGTPGGLQDGDLVMVEGRVDAASSDRFGKATFAVQNLQRLAYR